MAETKPMTDKAFAMYTTLSDKDRVRVIDNLNWLVQKAVAGGKEPERIGAGLMKQAIIIDQKAMDMLDNEGWTP